MIGRVAGGVLNHPHANIADVVRSPERHAGLAGVLRKSHLTPISEGERESGHLHESSIARSSGQRMKGGQELEDVNGMPIMRQSFEERR